ncbi:MAG: hypothetical protein HOO91_19370 [Bacteroidales bacterium]|nr:hypothetical protein [Bacteroidales bacterium]
MKYTFPNHLLKNKLIKRRLTGLTKDEIEDFFSSHAFPDSIKAIRDFFLSVGVKSVGYKLPKEKVKEIPLPFIAQFINPIEFVLVDDITDNELKITTSKDTKKEYSLEDFLSRWSGIVLSLDLNTKLLPSTRWSEKENISSKLDKIIILFLFLLIPYPLFRVVNDFNVSSLITLTLVAICLYSSYTLLRLENGSKSKFEEKICHASSKFDCQEVINSKISHPLSFISLAGLGFFFFSFLYLLILNFPLAEKNISIPASLISFSCLLISPFSISLILYQIFKIRRICPFCTLIQTSTIICGILFIINPLNLSAFFIKGYLYIITISLLFALSLTIILIVYYSRDRLNREVLGYHSLKHSRVVVETLLAKSPKLIPYDRRIILSSRIGRPEIIFALNPKCKHCYQAFLEYKHLLETIPNIGLGIIFIVYSDTINEVGGFIEGVEILYNKNDSTWLSMIDKWYSDPRFRKQNSYKQYNETNMINHLTWSSENSILSSPSIILENQLCPQKLSIIDLSDYLRSNFS